ncbi:MAG: tRNA 2-thiocytidine biosynthesis protein TtcA [Leptospiraceae bacterium]|nr:MAG: tRNA 2-thiocytidine biosynthesis protein TtcA [Leptospiraceae bacterium]
MLTEKKIDYYFDKINNQIGRIIYKYNLIRNGDRILVAVSGGKDSLTLLYFLKEFQNKAPVEFDILAFHLEQGQPGEDSRPLREIFEKWNVPYLIEHQNTYKIVVEKTKPNKIYCSLCSRLRRGIINRIAQEYNYNVVALGHHRDDVIETLLLNLFFAGKLSTMKPVYLAKKTNIRIIRPLYAVAEDWIQSFVQLKQWNVLPCNLCNNITNSQRKRIKMMLENFSKDYPHIKSSLYRAIEKYLLEENNNLLNQELENILLNKI